jgi:hypothetical protein
VVFFGRIQIDVVLEMQKWVDNLRSVEDEHIKLAIISANNHYAGFGHGTVNIFRNKVGLPEATWKERAEGEEQQPARDSKRLTFCCSRFKLVSNY